MLMVLAYLARSHVGFVNLTQSRRYFLVFVPFVWLHRFPMNSNESQYFHDDDDVHRLVFDCQLYVWHCGESSIFLVMFTDVAVFKRF